MSWEVGDLTFHPDEKDVVWAGTMSGPAVSMDGGVTWEMRRGGMPDYSWGSYSVPIQKVLIDPAQPERLLAMSGSHRHWNSPGNPDWGSVWESTDDGTPIAVIESMKMETTVAAPFSGRVRRILAATNSQVDAGTALLQLEPIESAGDGDVVYAAVDEAGIFRSTDDGHAWTAVNEGLPHTGVNWVTSHPTDPDIAWAALHNARVGGSLVQGGIYKTTDGGQTWQNASSGLPQRGGTDPNRTPKFDFVVVAESDPDVLLTSNVAWSNSGLWVSRDGGTSWQKTADDVDPVYPAGKSMEVGAIAPTDSDVMFAAGSEYILRTVDGGRSWQDVTAYSPSGSDGYRGTGYSGLVTKDFAFNPHDPEQAVFAAMDGGNIWISDDDLYSWRKAPSPIPNWGGGNAVAFSGDGTIWVTLGQGNFKGIARSTDGGANWTVLAGSRYGLPSDGSGGKAEDLYANPEDPDQVWAEVGNVIYRTTDGGESWAPVFERDANGLCDRPGAGSAFYVAADTGVFETGDGETFELIGGPEEASFCTTDPQRPQVVYAGAWRKSDGGLWRYDGWGEDDWGGIYFYNDERAETPWGDTRPDYGREEVRRYIRDNVMMWLEEYRMDGLRWDGTIFIRRAGFGEDAQDLPEGRRMMQEILEEVHQRLPGRLMIAEDLQGDPSVVRPPSEGGLGFDVQWDAGFVKPIREMLITPRDEERDVEAVRDALTPGDGGALQRVVYSESHDEVANGKARVPYEIDEDTPDSWAAQKRSTLGAALVFTAPGIPMLFQGQEFLEDGWFSDQEALDWDKLQEEHGIYRLYRDLIALRRDLGGTTGGLTGEHVDVHLELVRVGEPRQFLLRAADLPTDRLPVLEVRGPLAHPQEPEPGGEPLRPLAGGQFVLLPPLALSALLTLLVVVHGRTDGRRRRVSWPSGRPADFWGRPPSGVP